MRPVSEVVAHVDGSCRNSNRSYASAGLGAIIKFDNVRFAQVAVPFTGPESPTSTVSELCAALFALKFGVELCERFLALGFSVPQVFSILSDCEHVTKVFSGQRNSYKFRRLWADINNARLRLNESGVAVQVISEPGHAGYPGNEEADWLAKRASRRRSRNRGRVPHTFIKCLLENCPGSRHIGGAEELAAHVCAEHMNELEPATFDCDFCNLSFGSDRYLAAHYQRMHSAVSASKDDDQSGGTESSSEDDESSDKEQSDVECVFCQGVYDADDILRHLHADHFHDEDEYECSECGDTLVGLHFLAQHVQDVHNGELKTSAFASNSDGTSSDGTSSDENSDDDNSDDGNSDDENSDDENSDDENSSDDSCDDVTDSDSNEESDGFPSFLILECCFCDNSYGSINGLVRHWGLVHEVDVDDDVVQCEECELYFPGQDYLEMHCPMWHGV